MIRASPSRGETSEQVHRCGQHLTHPVTHRDGGSLTPTPGNIAFHETNGYDWSDRAIDIIRRASKGHKRGDATAVLRELLAEPSGLIEAILKRADTTPAAVTAELDRADRYPAHRAQRTVRTDPLSGASEMFVPAPPEHVWELLTTPARMPEWEPSIGSVEHAPAVTRVGDTWTALARTERPDGKAISVKPDFVKQQVELVAREESHLIEWRFTSPDAPQANARYLKIELEPAAGGTQLRLNFAWERNQRRSRRPVLGLSMRPVFRLVLWMQLSQLGTGISRAFR